MIFALILFAASSLRAMALLFPTDRDNLPTKAESASAARVQEFDSYAYVTYVKGSEYMEHVIRLTATLHETGSLDKYPHVYMVPEGSVAHRVAQTLQATAAQFGWNIKVQPYDAIAIKFHTDLSFWEEAWQRVTLYNMSDRFGRVLHLDADAYAFHNVERILVDGAVPSAARRQGVCNKQEHICTTTPVSNFMLISPNATIWKQIVEKLEILNSQGGQGPDETIQFQFAEHVGLLSPSNITYFDCFKHMPDDNLTAAGYDVDNLPGIVHLGVPGKAMINDFKKKGLDGAGSTVFQGQRFKQKIWDKTKEIYSSEEVQAMMKALDSKSTRAEAESIHRYSDICD